MSQPLSSCRCHSTLTCSQKRAPACACLRFPGGGMARELSCACDDPFPQATPNSPVAAHKA
eukprot:1160092-Pelagomonas_calceolata.AAC.10